MGAAKTNAVEDVRLVDAVRFGSSLSNGVRANEETVPVEAPPTVSLALLCLGLALGPRK